MKEQSERKNESLLPRAPVVLLISARADLGGGPKYLEDFARALLSSEESGGNLAKDHLFIAAPDELPFGPRFRSLASAFFPLPHRSFSFIAFFRLLRFARKHGVNIIHSHGRGAGVYSRLMKPFGFTIVHTYHGIHQDPSLLGRLKLAIDRILYFFTDLFLFVSENEKQDAIRIHLNPPSDNRILHPIAPPCFLGGSSQFQSPVRLGCIARFDYQKGLDLLFRHLSEFKKTYPAIAWTFTLAGGKGLHIPEEIRTHVSEIGPTSTPLEFLRGLDVYVSSSRWEGLPITVLEAISQGLPVLLSRVRGHGYFEEQGVATAFDLEDSKDFTAKLSALLTHPKPRPHFEWIERYHRVMDVARQYEPFI